MRRTYAVAVIVAGLAANLSAGAEAAAYVIPVGAAAPAYVVLAGAEAPAYVIPVGAEVPAYTVPVGDEAPAHVSAMQGPIVPPPTTPPPTSKTHDVQQLLTVRGCIRGTRLNFDPSAAINAQARALDTPSFVLEGPKELMQQLKAGHEGHEDEITGIVSIPSTHDVVGTTKKVGPKTTVSVGSRQRTDDSLNPVESRKPLRLKVQGITHIEGKCATGI